VAVAVRAEGAVGDGTTTVTEVVARPTAPVLSVAVKVTVYEPPDAYACVGLTPEPNCPSPKSQL
jgi:hypothetical protein